MKYFISNKILKKIFLITLLLLFLGIPGLERNEVQADDDSGNYITSAGGKLAGPIMELVQWIGDGINELIQQNLMGHDANFTIDLSIEWYEKLWNKYSNWVIGVTAAIVAVGLICFCPPLAGAVSAIAGALSGGSAVGYAIVAGALIFAPSVGVGIVAAVSLDGLLPDYYLHLPVYSVTPEEIFKNEVPMLDVNFFNPVNNIIIDPDVGVEEKLGNISIAGQLQSTISNWYNTIRNISVVLMLSILLYIGIRILLSTIATDKAKYKELLMDWFVGMCLLVFMHYIMVFSVTIVEQITKAVSGSDKDVYVARIVDDDGRIQSALDKIPEDQDELGLKKMMVDGSFVYTSPNLMGRVRMEAQINTGTASILGFTLCYLVLIIYTVVFLFTYIRRVFYLAFLTLIAPFVAMTYAIDKSVDGQAQGFNKWLKEYIFNLLIQPLHLILYTILIGSVFAFAGINTLYMLVAIGAMIPAEKILRSLFGFEKSSTAGSLAAASVGGAMLMNSMNSLARMGRGSGKSSGRLSGGSGGDEHSNAYIRPAGGRTNESAVLGNSLSDRKIESEDKTEQPKTKNSSNLVTTLPIGDNPMDDEVIDNEQNSDGGYEMKGSNGAENEEKQFDSESSGEYNFVEGQGDELNNSGDARQSYNTNPLDTVDEKLNADDANIDFAVNSGDEDMVAAENFSGGNPVQDSANLSIPEENNNKSAFSTNLNVQSNSTPIDSDTSMKSIGDKEVKEPSKLVRRAKTMGKVGLETSKVLGKAAVKSAPKVAKAGAMAVGATVGAAAGIATGNPSNLLKGAAAGAVGAAGAYGVGERATGTIVSGANSVKRGGEEIERKVLGEQAYAEKVNERQYKAMKKDKQLVAELEQRLSKEKVKDMEKDGSMREYVRNGITSAKDIASVQKSQDLDGLSREQAIAVKSYSDRCGKVKTMGADDKASYINRWAEELGSKDKAEQVFELVRKQQKHEK